MKTKNGECVEKNVVVYHIVCEIKAFFREPVQTLCSFLLPAVILISSSLIWGNEIIEGFSYINFVLPGCFALVIMTTSFYSLSVPYAKYKELKVIVIVEALPNGNSILIVALAVSRALILLLQIILLVTISSLMFTIVFNSLFKLFYAIIVSLLFFYFYSYIIAVVSKTSLFALTVANSLYVGLTFISGSFFSVRVLPSAVSYVAQIFPLYHIVQPIRRAWTGQSNTFSWYNIAVLLCWVILGLVILTIYNRSEKRGNQNE